MENTNHCHVVPALTNIIKSEVTFVVYFDQQTGALHTIQWSNSHFSVFWIKKWQKGGNYCYKVGLRAFRYYSYKLVDTQLLVKT